MPAPPKSPRIAIVIPTANPEREPGRTAIAQARKTTAHLNVSFHIIQSSGPEFRFSRSVNRGIREAPDADYWVLLNDDAFMDEGWLDAMVETARCHPNVGVVGAVLRFPKGRIQHGGGYMMKPVRYFFYNTFGNMAPFWAIRSIIASIRRGVPYFGHYRRIHPRQRLDFVTGANMLITKECRARIGDYDEDFEFSYEDVDYCLRALDAGLEIALATDARGIHLQRATGGGLKAEVMRSLKVFDRRWSRDRVLSLTRKDGRRGVYHGSGMACGCGAGADGKS